MKSFLHPTIGQRVFLTLLVAFVLVWAALLVYIYVDFRQALAVDQGLKKLGRATALALADARDDAEARTVMKTTETQFQTLRISGNPAGSVLFQLQDRDNSRTVYASRALGSTVLAAPPMQVVEQDIGGKDFWVYQGDTGRWSLHVAEPQTTGGWIIERNARRLLPYLLLAFPIVLLPVWFAVRHGLKPLQQLADRIAARGSTDLSPIGLDPKYAELKPLVKALEDMLQQLRSKMAREHAFVHDAAHELRTPMAVIAAQAHALAGAGSSEDQQRAQAHLEQAIGRASHLTQQLLELASLDDAQRAVARIVDVAQLSRQILAQAAPEAMARHIELVLDAPDTLAACIDVPAFHSILENLLNNAIRYVQDGAQVAVGLRADDRHLTLSVEDDGPGIAEPERERVFERFHRGTGHEAAGSGLGLAIVKQAVDRIGGSLTLSSGLQNRGAGFHVSLALVAPISRDSPASRS